MSDEIRRARVEDYDSIVAINNATWPQFVTTKQEMLEHDRHRIVKYKSGRLVLERSSKILGVAQYDQLHTELDPHTFWIEINVHPEYQQQGIGRALYSHLLEELKPHKPLHYRIVIRDDDEHAKQVFYRRGFYEAWTAYDTVLDLNTVDVPKLNGIIEKLEQHGIRLYSLSDLSHDKNRDVKAYALHTGTRRDAPMAAPASELSVEQYVSTVLHGEINPHAFFVAVSNDQYIGLAFLRITPQEEKYIRLAWLGTEEHHRSQGIGTALLARAALYAKSKGFHEMHTSLTSLNPKMLSVAEKFGFTRPYGISHLHKDIPEEATDTIDPAAQPIKEPVAS